jgi:hypothetical protein
VLLSGRFRVHIDGMIVGGTDLGGRGYPERGAHSARLPVRTRIGASPHASLNSPGERLRPC